MPPVRSVFVGETKEVSLTADLKLQAGGPLTICNLFGRRLQLGIAFQGFFQCLLRGRCHFGRRRLT